MENKKMNFFVRVKNAIFNLENYEQFVNEKFSKSLKYFFTLALIVACVLAGISTSRFLNMLKKGIEYVKNDVPDFSYSEGELKIGEYVEGYDEEYGVGIIVNTADNVSEDNIEEYKRKYPNIGFILLKDKLIYSLDGVAAEYNYKENLDKAELYSFNKEEFIDKTASTEYSKIVISTFIIFLTIVFISEVISLFADWVVISIFAWCASKICKVNLKFESAFNISIYALTLPILLTIIYEFSNYFWGFYTEYFRIVYLLISYVYIIASILMMKTDNMVKQTVKIENKCEQVEKKSEELIPEPDEKNEETEEKKDDEKEDKTNDENSTVEKEPDGSEI